jgi:hypothetical protein
MARVSFWSIFSQTHLVTLIASEFEGRKCFSFFERLSFIFREKKIETIFSLFFAKINSKQFSFHFFSGGEVKKMKVVA